MPRSSSSATAAEAGEGDDRPLGAPGRAPRRGRAEPRVTIDAGQNPTESESLRHELRRWGLCRTFVHQFRLLAQRAKPNPAPAKKRKRRGGGIWRPYRVAPKREPGLAAIKHAQQNARPPPKGERLAPCIAVECGWPEDMRLELFACRTVEDRQVWEQKWSDHLSGRAAQQSMEAMRPTRTAAHGLRASVVGPWRADFG
jgi:hypothetical protein